MESFRRKFDSEQTKCQEKTGAHQYERWSNTAAGLSLRDQLDLFTKQVEFEEGNCRIMPKSLAGDVERRLIREIQRIEDSVRIKKAVTVEYRVSLECREFHKFLDCYRHFLMRFITKN